MKELLMADSFLCEMRKPSIDYRDIPLGEILAMVNQNLASVYENTSKEVLESSKKILSPYEIRMLFGRTIFNTGTSLSSGESEIYLDNLGISFRLQRKRTECKSYGNRTEFRMTVFKISIADGYCVDLGKTARELEIIENDRIKQSKIDQAKAEDKAFEDFESKIVNRYGMTLKDFVMLEIEYENLPYKSRKRIIDSTK